MRYKEKKKKKGKIGKILNRKKKKCPRGASFIFAENGRGKRPPPGEPECPSAALKTKPPQSSKTRRLQELAVKTFGQKKNGKKKRSFKRRTTRVQTKTAITEAVTVRVTVTIAVTVAVTVAVTNSTSTGIGKGNPFGISEPKRATNAQRSEWVSLE